MLLVTEKTWPSEIKRDGDICYYCFVIIQTSKPYTSEQIDQLKELFEVYIKTVIDVERKICVVGIDRHFEGEQMLYD